MPDRGGGTAEARIGQRILDVEWRRRAPGDPPSDLLSALGGLPPLSVLAGRAFPRWVLDRRLTFLEKVGWDRPLPPTLTSLGDLPQTVTIPEDMVALVAGAVRVATDDPFLAALARCFGRPCDGPDQSADAVQQLDDLIDRFASRPAATSVDTGPDPAVSPTRSRMEALTVRADRRFGRSGMARGWEGLYAAVSAAGRAKRAIRP